MGLRPAYADENKFGAVILSEASAAFSVQSFTAVILSEASAAFSVQSFTTAILSEASAAFSVQSFTTVILSEASVTLADAESKDPYTANPATADKRLFGTRPHRPL